MFEISTSIYPERFYHLHFLADCKENILEEYDIFDKSNCAIDPKEKTYFKEIMENLKFKTAIRYKGTRDGWKAADFHRMSDGIGPSVILFKIKENGHCVGGFTRA